MSNYNIILQDLFERRNTQEMQPPPYTAEMDITSKIEVTYNCLLRAQRLKQRISSLTFAYYLGQLMENRKISKRSCKLIVTDHFYIAAIRVYYIFELNPVQIFATKVTTLSMVRKLKQHEFRKLTLEL